MKGVLNTVVKAVGDQAIALAVVDERVTALKRTLARQFPEIADELKGQIETEQEQSRTAIYELQVSLAKLREAITQLPEAEGKVARKRPVSKALAADAGKSQQAR